MNEISASSIKVIENEVERDLDAENIIRDGWMRWRQTGLQLITQQNGFRILCKNITICDGVCTFEPVHVAEVWNIPV